MHSLPHDFFHMKVRVVKRNEPLVSSARLVVLNKFELAKYLFT